MRVGERVDTAPAFWFEINVGDHQWMVVQSVTGVGVSWEKPLEIWEDATHYRIVPTKKKWSNIVLKGPTFDTNSTAIAFETIELTHLGLTRDS